MIVLGAGIVGVCVAIHLQRRGRDVLLVDRTAPGRETSYGNAGIIQREGVRPRSFPRDLGSVLRAASNSGLDSRYDFSALPEFGPKLARYWWHSEPERYRKIVAEYAPLIAQSVSEHAELIGAAGADGLIEKKGWTVMFRTAERRDQFFAEAERDARQFGVGSAQLDAEAFAKAEPDLQLKTAGALHWTDPWTVRDPGALVAAYAELFQKLGGTLAVGDAQTLHQVMSGWGVETSHGGETAAEVVMALGPWAGPATCKLGYRLPLFIKRGYHQEYAPVPGVTLNRPMLDIETGYLLAPMRRGIRLTTGAEFARHDAPPNYTQLEGTEKVARQIFALGTALDDTPWMGARPCTPDMKPTIGRAPKHNNVWFAFGHAHHGLTLGAVTGRMLAEMMTGETPFVDARPFAAERFL